MKLNLDNVFESLDKATNFKLEVLQNKDGLLRVQSLVTAPNLFKNPILFQTFVHEDGTCHVLLTLDTVEKTLDNFLLINELNANNPLFTGYIIDRGDAINAFELHAVNLCVADDDVVSFVSYILNTYIASEQFLKYLSPIVSMADNFNN